MCLSIIISSPIYPTIFFAKSHCVMENHVLLFQSLLHFKGYCNCPFKKSKARAFVVRFFFNAPSSESIQVLISKQMKYVRWDSYPNSL